MLPGRVVHRSPSGRPSRSPAIGVFQNLIDCEYAAGAFRWYCAHEPACSLFMYGHAFGLTGVSPKTSACCAWTFGVVTYFIHMYAQFGCGAFLASIHVSAQPVAPSLRDRSP